MKDCNIIRDLLPLYIDECCTQDSRQFVDEHLKKCAECQKVYEQMCQQLKVSDEEKKENLTEELFFSKGKKIIEEEIKKDYMQKAAMVDLVLNLILFALISFLQTGTNVLNDLFGTEGVFFSTLALGVLGFWSIGETLLLYYCHKGMESYISRMVVRYSIGMKVIVLVFAFLTIIVLTIVNV